jgi:hypothetical protein
VAGSEALASIDPESVQSLKSLYALAGIPGFDP